MSVVSRSCRSWVQGLVFIGDFRKLAYWGLCRFRARLQIAIGPQQGRKVFTLQSLPPVQEPKVGSSRVARVAGFSLQDGVVAQVHQRDKLEQLC